MVDENIPIAQQYRSVPALLEARASVHGEEPLLHYQEENYSYADVNRMANAIANALAARGVEQGDHVCTFIYNAPEYLALWFGLSKLGAVFVPLNVALEGDDLAYIVDDAGAETVVLEADTRDQYESARWDLTAVTDEYLLGEDADGYHDFDQLLDGDESQPPDVEVAEDEPASIIYTSGTTGLPKGVVLPHFSYVNTGAVFADRVNITAEDRLFSSLPLFHSAGQQLAVMSTLTTGTDIALARWFSASNFWEQIHRYDATRFFYIGTMLQALLSQDERNDDRDHPAAYGMGAAAPEELIPDFEERFDVELLDSYGLTEIGTIATFNEPGERNATRDGSAGRPVEDIELRIVDHHDRPVESGEVGEILLRSMRANTTMLGYYGEHEQTVDAWQNLWLHTGDMGYVDDAGNLYFVDRKAYTIRHRGENVSSRQVEKTLLTHPAVEEVAVVGVPGELGDEDVKAVVKTSETVDPADLIAHCEGRLAAFKIPRYVEFTESFPKTETERIEKYKLKAEGIGDAWDRKESEQ